MKTMPSTPVDNSDVFAARERLAAGVKMMNDKLGPAPPTISESYHDVPMRDGFLSTTKIQKPASGPAGPLVVLYFGGGFVGGDKDQMSGIGRILVSLFGATVVSAGYRLAPEHPFPYGQLDSLDTTKWAAENATASILSADPSKGFIIGGVSAGGSIAAAVSRKVQEEEKLAHPLTGQWLCIPSLMDHASCPEEYKHVYLAYEQNGDTAFLGKESREMMAKASAWDNTSDLRYAVLSKAPISGQPRTYTQVEGMDPLRDDGLIYDELLKKAGVPTRIDLYPGCPHGHFMMMQGYEIGDKAFTDIGKGFAWLLEKEVPDAVLAKILGGSAA
jgi:acetyl esterase/lipase